MGYPAVKCFWVEPSGNVEICMIFKDGRKTKERATKEIGEKMFSGMGRPDDADHRSMSPLYRLPDGSECTSRDLPPGAVYRADWLEPEHAGPDGMAINTVTPDKFHWSLDLRASNCTLPDDKEHRCWCRHGDPRIPGQLHVDKIGLTCKAGGGSIQTPNYHGMLQNGEFSAG